MPVKTLTALLSGVATNTPVAVVRSERCSETALTIAKEPPIPSGIAAPQIVASPEVIRTFYETIVKKLAEAPSRGGCAQYPLTVSRTLSVSDSRPAAAALDFIVSEPESPSVGAVRKSLAQEGWTIRRSK